jgi:hypothetical protein
MATTKLTIGPIHSITQNTVYALPASKVMVHAGAAVEVSNVIDSGFGALTGANTVGAETAAAFIRCPGGDTTVRLAK